MECHKIAQSHVIGTTMGRFPRLTPVQLGPQVPDHMAISAALILFPPLVCAHQCTRGQLCLSYRSQPASLGLHASAHSYFPYVPISVHSSALPLSSFRSGFGPLHELDHSQSIDTGLCSCSEIGLNWPDTHNPRQGCGFL